MGSYYSSGSSYFSSASGIFRPVGTTITTIGPQSGAAAGVVTAGQTAGSAVWPAANRAIFVPIHLDQTVLIKQMFVYNGTVAAGNVDIGIYGSTASLLPGTRLVSSGSTAMSGTSAPQVFDIADTTLDPGVYHFALVMSDATATVFRGSLHQFILTGSNVTQQAAALPLPATATPAAPASAYLPVFGASQVTVL